MNEIIKYWKHLCTILRHKYYVLILCTKCGYFWRGLVHDMSKFSPTEFVASARNFQGNKSPIEAEKAALGYSAAWLHHKGRNKHHWEYWCDYNENGDVIAAKIPYKYVVEMVCDWISAGLVYGGKRDNEALAYYNKVRQSRHFHPETETLILYLLNTLATRGYCTFYKVITDKSIGGLKSKYERGLINYGV